jgi:hypothetical protein
MLACLAEVQRPLPLGGLGTEPDRVWALLPVKKDLIPTTFFRASILFKLGDGRMTMFWQDAWLSGRSIASLAPNLYTAISKCRRCDHNVCALCDQEAKTLDHLLTGCAFAWETWFLLLRRGGW